ncbi:hypothetical protein G4B88_015916 [Cannabis sativa]|uniref:Uncharacterized protein n=1 Tax=Cannabis sativa TaxID=3483 RepID=A0A7J6ESB0_CANSA|nr:hypothetical protein G4B88_015916 [Cannabis sativa]
MESAGSFPDGDWESSFSSIFSLVDGGQDQDHEDLEFIPHFLGQCSFIPSNNNDVDTNNINVEGALFGYQNTSQTDHDHDHESFLFQTLDSLNSTLQFLSQDQSSCYTTTDTTITSSSTHQGHGSNDNYNSMLINNSYNYTDSYHHNNIINQQVSIDRNNNNVLSMTTFLMDDDDKKQIIHDYDDCGDKNYKINQQETSTAVISGKELLPAKRKYDVVPDDKIKLNKKKTRASRNNVQKGKKNLESKKRDSTTTNGKVEKTRNMNIINGVDSSTSYSSEEDNNVTNQENITNGDEISHVKSLSGAVNLNGKTRATRGSATDPQSLYARVRTNQ